jgi:hypothetical protein
MWLRHKRDVIMVGLRTLQSIVYAFADHLVGIGVSAVDSITGCAGRPTLTTKESLFHHAPR